MPAKPTRCTKGFVREGEAGKKAKVAQHAAGKSVSEKSEDTRNSKNLFEKYTHQKKNDVVKDRRMSKNGVELLIGWSDFPNIKYEMWESITNLPGSEDMIVFQEFPRLSHVFRQYLSVSATSESPE
jgi:hypothetical protein